MAPPSLPQLPPFCLGTCIEIVTRCGVVLLLLRRGSWGVVVACSVYIESVQ